MEEERPSRRRKLKPDMVWLGRDSRNRWRKVVVDVMVTSTDKMNESFKEKDEKYRELATRETRENNVVMAGMVPLIISHGGAVHKDTVKRWKNVAPDIKIDWVRMARSVLQYNVVIVGKIFNDGSGVTEAWKREARGF